MVLYLEDSVGKVKRKLVRDASAKLRELPNNLSGLLKVALKDLKKVIDKERVDGLAGSVDMGAWIMVTSNRSCEVCLAGACIGNRLKLKPLGKFGEFISIGPDDMTVSVARKMKALNEIRKGRVYAALDYLGKIPKRWPEDLSWGYQVAYFQQHKPEPFFRDMEEMIARLKHHKL